MRCAQEAMGKEVLSMFLIIADIAQPRVLSWQCGVTYETQSKMAVRMERRDMDRGVASGEGSVKRRGGQAR